MHFSPLIRIECLEHNLGAAEQQHRALDGASLDVRPGEWVAVIGPSGCGKSTLLHMTGGLSRPQSGSVTIGDVVVSDLDDRRRALFRRRHVGYVFQHYNLVDDLTVRQNVELPLLLCGSRRRRAAIDAVDMLDRLGLASKADAWPGQLSGGEQQRVAIARALIARPAVVLADEPTGALDSHASAAVVGLLRAACEQGQAIVMVTHDPDVAHAADRVVRMRDGVVHSDVAAGVCR